MKFRVLLMFVGLGGIAFATWWMMSNSSTISNLSVAPTPGQALIPEISPSPTITLTPIPEPQSTTMIDSIELSPAFFSDLLKFQGLWQSELVHIEGGTDYHLEYEFHIFPSSFVVTLIQRTADLDSSLLEWRGVADTDPTINQLWYYWLNPSGSVEWKSLQANEESLALEYEMFDDDGELEVFLNVLTLVHKYRFDSITYVEKDNGWQEIERKIWLKVSL